ncbi:bifunctional DNA primase/polymerase [Streptomyces sp. NBC_01497]|uniref:bifunctional DNA primase/polymerase n=1 Tax=Streptomyces sp. NBC_01497 TaxID=2903885 RepID=UPI002E36644E|nr:bifunctional DNA primase/polymerase [Streptomyces sp. NBC_01497]
MPYSSSTSSARAPVVPDPASVAHWCASQGWPVHPLTPGRKTPAANCRRCSGANHERPRCTCKESGRWCHGFHSATLDPALIDRWWRLEPRFGIGVACGAAGLVVVDIDAHPGPLPVRSQLLPGIPIPEGVDLSGLENGYHTLGVLAALRDQPSPADDLATLRVRTPSGGLHVWYRARPGRPFQSSSGSGGKRALAWQVDIRARGGYIIAPGTRTDAGRYVPVSDVLKPAELPNWLADELDRTHHSPTAPSAREASLPPRAQLAVAAARGEGSKGALRLMGNTLAEVSLCGSQSEGAGFSEKLNRAAYTAGGLVGAGLLSEAEARSTLLHTALSARPGQEARASSIIRSGLAAGMRAPFRPGGLP